MCNSQRDCYTSHVRCKFDLKINMNSLAIAVNLNQEKWTHILLRSWMILLRMYCSYIAIMDRLITWAVVDLSLTVGSLVAGVTRAAVVANVIVTRTTSTAALSLWNISRINRTQNQRHCDVLNAVSTYPVHILWVYSCLSKNRCVLEFKPEQ